MRRLLAATALMIPALAFGSASPIKDGAICVRMTEARPAFTHIGSQLTNQAGVVLASIEQLGESNYSFRYRNGKTVVVTINGGNGKLFPFSVLLPDTFWTISNSVTKKLMFICEV